MRRRRQRSRTRPDCSCCWAGRNPLHRPGRIRLPRTYRKETVESSAQAGADHIADALARIHATATKEPASAKKPKGGAENAPVQYPVWAFVVTWTELDQWRTHYDPAVLAVELTGEHVATFLRVIEHTVAFVDALQSALANPSGATASGTVDVNDERGDEPAGGRPQLRAI